LQDFDRYVSCKLKLLEVSFELWMSLQHQTSEVVNELVGKAFEQFESTGVTLVSSYSPTCAT